jgi:hypothetical protein
MRTMQTCDPARPWAASDPLRVPAAAAVACGVRNDARAAPLSRIRTNGTKSPMRALHLAPRFAVVGAEIFASPWSRWCSRIRDGEQCLLTAS